MENYEIITEEDRVEASFLLDADDFEDEDRVQLRVYQAIMEKSAIYNEEFGAGLVQTLLSRSDFAAVDLVQELATIGCPDSRRGFFRLLLLVPTKHFHAGHTRLRCGYWTKCVQTGSPLMRY
jgi:hypothetical protein